MSADIYKPAGILGRCFAATLFWALAALHPAFAQNDDPFPDDYAPDLAAEAVALEMLADDEPDPAEEKDKANEAGADQAPAELAPVDLPPVEPIQREYARIRGVNYIPAYAGSSYEFWAEYDGAAIRRELALARELGFNSVRTWLNFNVYEETPTPFLERWADFVQACKREGLTLLPILFDCTGVDPADLQTGRERTREAYQRFLSNPSAYRLRQSYRNYVGAIARQITPDRSIPAADDPGVVYWGDWTPSPGHDRLGKSRWDRYAEYLRKVMIPYRDDAAIVAWDVVNKPNAGRAFSNVSRRVDARDFVEGMLDYAREIAPAQPLTVSTSGGWSGARYYELRVDLIALQFGGKTPAEIGAETREALRRSRGKPVLATEAGAVMFPGSPVEAGAEHQASKLRMDVMVLEKAGVGYYLWHLIEGDGPTPWAALVGPEGKPKPAAEWFTERAAWNDRGWGG